MELKSCTGINGEKRDYILYPKAIPPYEQSDYITDVLFDTFRYHSGEGNMWPITWANDDCLYCGAGDNKGCSTNLWRVTTFDFEPGALTSTGRWSNDMINPDPANIREVLKDKAITSIKPSGLLDIDGTLYLSMEAQNYGDNPLFGRQHNFYGWILKSTDRGISFTESTDRHFFTGSLSSCHFLQFGKGYAGARDEFVYAYFPYDMENGQSYWENSDALLLGRVPKDSIMDRSAWEFYASDSPNAPQWSSKVEDARPVFCYTKTTGSNHVVYNAGIGRYIMGNYSFIDEELNPRPIHQMEYPESSISQLTLYEAPEPWGPWKLFYRDDDWGTYGDYQPNFPTKWMTDDGHLMYMVSSGSWDDYNFVVQKVALKLKGETEFPKESKFFRYIRAGLDKR